jgi:von Willebrand factor type A domain
VAGFSDFAGNPGKDDFMRVRHRIPNLFTLSMVDVLCCALGCVILLWLINLRDAKHHEDTAAEKLAVTSAMLAKTQEEREGAHQKYLDQVARTEVVEKDKAALSKERAALLLTGQQLDKNLKDANGRIASLSDDLLARGKRIESLAAQAADLTQKLQTALKRAETLQGQADLLPGLRADLKEARQKLLAEEAQVRDQLRAMAEASKTLEATRGARAALERDMQSRDKELAQLRPLKDRLPASEEKAATLEKLMIERGKDLAQANQNLEAAREEKNIWQKEAVRARSAVDNRFAGIALTGKRVIFLVDMSGSMELVDEKTQAPNKWSEVAATVAKLMRSLPDLEKFQVVIFSEKVSYLLGGENQWLDFDAKTSPDTVLRALNNIKPTGGTNMYDAFQSAFRFRPAGLDTIYFLSDGLPNMGAGVPDDVARNLKEVDLSERLAKHIRRTMNNNWNSKNRPEPRVRINTIGFFYESPDVGAFLWALARENDGSFVGMSKP